LGESAKRRGGATNLAPGLVRVLIPPAPEKRYRAIRSAKGGRSAPGEHGLNLSPRHTNPGRRYHDLTAVGIWNLRLIPAYFQVPDGRGGRGGREATETYHDYLRITLPLARGLRSELPYGGTTAGSRHGAREVQHFETDGLG
jgi:hypothetical protein